MMVKPRFKLLHSRFLLMVTLIAFSACTPESEDVPPNGCISSTGGIAIVPTATRQTDPDLFSPPAPPDGGDGADYCPTPIPAETPAGEFPEQFVTTEVTNLSLDIENQDLAAVAVGDDMLAVAWISDGDVYVALSRGGNHFQVRRVDYGDSVSLAFSEANRLHVVYDRFGEVFYRAADQGIHPADTSFISTAGQGHNPQIAIDSRQWAHIIYESEGNIWHAAHQYEFYWLTELIGPGERPSLITGPQRLGVPKYGSRDFALAYVSGNEVHVRLYGITPFLLPGWLSVAAIPVPEPVAGFVGLDATEIDGQLWLYAAWVSERPSTASPTPLYQQPIFEAVNPLFPEQIANPDHIYAGLNAVRWRSETELFDAGLWQTITVPDPGSPITFEAWGLTDTAAGAEMTLQIGIDPTGGTAPNGASVVWSAVAAPTSFTQLRLIVPAQGSSATLFLRGTFNTAAVPGTAVWDSAVIQNGQGVNLDFEAPFVSQDFVTVPEGWTAWYQDSGNLPPGGRDVYTVYAAWSDSGGFPWIGPEVITANRDLSGGATGTIRPDVTPVISLATEPPSVSFFYIYEAGDPPSDSTFLRFGRPFQTQCDLGTTNCTDTPGIPLLPRNVVRPSYRLLAAADPFNPDRAFLVWDSLQTDIVNKDVYATYVVLR